MTLARTGAIFSDTFSRTLGRPMLWTLFGIATLLAWGLSTGELELATGATRVGGGQTWVTSELGNAFVFCMVASTLYAFFVSVFAGLAVLRDEESGIEELLHTTRLRASEYVAGKALAILAAFSVVLALQVLATMLFQHVLPGAAAETRGPFHMAAYLRPALLFAVPTMVFFGGMTFYVGARLRKPALAFLAPLATSTVCLSIFWEWRPTWIDPRLDALLVLLDPSGYRWLHGTWFEIDRGVDFYDTATMALDGLILANRVLFLALGVLAVALARRHVSGVRSPRAASRFRLPLFGRSRKRAAPEVESPETTADVPAADARPVMSHLRVPFLRSVLCFAGAELRAVLGSPVLYLFWLFVLSQSLATSVLGKGPFQTTLLMTSGQHAAGAFDRLSLLVCLVLLVFTVEGLERDRATGIRPIVRSTPHPTAAWLLGKNLAMAALAAAVLIASALAGSIDILMQGRVVPEIGPYLLLWGLLMVPTFLFWTALVSAIYAATDSRYQTLGVGLALIASTLFRFFTGKLSWLGNWLLWNGASWSDFGALEVDRKALVLNRLLVLALSVGLLAVASRLVRRRDPDATGLLRRLNGKLVRREALRLSPAFLIPVTIAVPLWLAVANSTDGERARDGAREYWKRNYATWKDAPQPSLAAVDVDLWLDPATSAFRTRGTFELRNHHDEALPRLALSGGRHWRDLSWTLDGEPTDPENRSGLYVFEIDGGLAPGGTVTIGFELEGRHPDGTSRGGRDLAEFILPSGVVLTNLGPVFVPTVGFNEERGVGDENAMDPPEYPDDLYRETLPPALAGPRPFSVRLAVDTPEEYVANGVGSLESEVVADGRRRRVWVTDHPVRLFNVVANRWAVFEGKASTIYYHPEHHHNVEAMSRVLDAAREHYSRWFAPYPWQELKLSEFPAHATYAQGFPTNITFSESVGFLTRPDRRTNAVLLVTAHEAAHQWWANLLMPGMGPGSNVLTEGLSHFSALMLVEELEGPIRRMELARRLEEGYGRQRRKDAERPLVKVDGSRPGDRVVLSNKGGLVAWMLLEHLGRDRMLDGLQDFLREFGNGPDHPLLEDLAATLRSHAEDPEAFDALVDQWLFDVVLPEYRLSEIRVLEADGEWTTTAVLTNHGTGKMAVEVAAVAGDRSRSEPGDGGYRSAGTTVMLGAGESRSVRVVSDFEPERLVVDPDVEVLMLRRRQAEARL